MTSSDYYSQGATGAPAKDNPYDRPGMLRRAAIVLLLLLATVLSIATTEYGFCVGDATGQVPLVVHAMNPALLNRDPLITELGAQYKSAAIVLLAALAKVTSLYIAYAVVFVVARFLLVISYYRLALCVTARPAVALVAVFVLAGFGYYGIGMYCCGIPLVEGTFVPRVAALPFALFALAASIDRKNLAVAIWLSMTLLLHPLTGLCAIGLHVVYAMLDWRRRNAFSFVTSLALPLAAMVLTYFWTYRHSGTPLRIDREWLAIIDRVNGPYLFLLKDIARVRFLTSLTFAAISLIVLREAAQGRIFVKVALACGAALLTHMIGADLLAIHLLVNACPERASYAIVALSGIALATLIERAWRMGRLHLKLLAGALFASFLFRADNRVIVVAIAACLVAVAWGSSFRTWRLRVVMSVAAAFIVFAAVGLFPSMSRSLTAGVVRSNWHGFFASDVLDDRFSPPVLFHGWRDLRSLGMRNFEEKIPIQQWIRDSTPVDAVLSPPPGNTHGWQVVSERACILRPSFFSYTLLSRKLALDFQAFMRRYPRNPNISWAECVRFGRGEGADFVLVDDRIQVHQPEDPQPLHSSGHYHVLAARPTVNLTSQSGFGKP